MTETILITGGSGFVATMLTKAFLADGSRVVVFDLKPGEPLSSGNESSIVRVCGDVTNISQLFNIVKNQRVTSVIHLAALLSEPSEANPWASIGTNAFGTWNVLEAARMFEVHKVVLASSMAVYVNSALGRQTVTEQTIQRPQLIYGVNKVYAELLGLYYQRKFGIDVRGIRFPALIGPNVESAGFGQYASKIIQSAAQGIPFEVNVPEDTIIPLLYVKDAIRAVQLLHSARKRDLITRIYNIGQIMPAPKTSDIVQEVRRFYPDAQFSFKPDPAAMEVVRSTPMEIRCDEAMNEWGWNVAYSLGETVSDFILTLEPSTFPRTRI